MNKYKIGDIILFKNEGIKLYSNVGMVLVANKEIITILQINGYGNYRYKVDINSIRPISEKENVIQEINKYYNNEIEKQELLIKSVKRSDYKEEVVEKYYLLKNEIINTAKNMVELDSENDTDFESKLKAICQKKKELFAIKCEGLNEARKYNGEVKYNIKELIRRRDKLIKGLDENLEKLKEELGMEEF